MRFNLHSKTPLPIVIGLILNLILVIALEILLVYRYPAPPDSAALAQADPNFQNSTILIRQDQFLLAEQTDGSQHIVPYKTHPFFFNRCRIYNKEIKEVNDQTGTQAFRLGLRLYHVTAYPDYLQISSAGGYSGQQTILMYYLCLSGFLALVELEILEKIKGK
ncbi:MAG: hypothetical protein J6J12_05315 [Oscillospiraceae bacterium]|nr:hypothetical protein [Oscillospiraceae bacterium]